MRARRRDRPARGRAARRPALLPGRRERSARQRQGRPRPAAAGSCRLRRRGRRADAALVDGTVVAGEVVRGMRWSTQRSTSVPRAGARVARAVGRRALRGRRRAGAARRTRARAADRGRGGAASLLGQASLGAIAHELGVDSVDPRRFRMNFGIEGLEPHDEDSWIGRRVQVGDAVVVPRATSAAARSRPRTPETGPRSRHAEGARRYRGERADDRAAAVRRPRRRRRAGPRARRRPGLAALSESPERPRRGVVPGGLQVGESGVKWGAVDHAAR